MLLILGLSVLWCAFPSFAQDGPVVTTPLGVIEGVYDKTYAGRMYSAFFSIPYAKPPVGDLRFEDPQPIEPWKGTWMADANKTCCAQLLHIAQAPRGLYQGTEDCLYLQVYVPRKNPNPRELLDVFVFIHGGAYMFGCSLIAGPKFLMDRDIVLVSINYRVGVMGFLSTEDDVMPGNLGMKDQVQALKWVNENIQSFGGNPKSVTITGLSSGSSSVHFHYLSPLSKGLFHRGISQSGTALSPWAVQKEALMKTRFVGSRVGCNQADTRELVDCLKQRPVRQLVETAKLMRPWMFNPFSPLSVVVEKAGNNRFLLEHPYALLAKGKVHDVPWLTSLTAHEGLYPGADLLKRDDILPELDKKWIEMAPHILHYNHTVVPRSSMDEVSKLLRKTYLGDQRFTRGNFYKLIEMFTDRLFALSSERAALMQAKVNKSPVYFYFFGVSRKCLVSLTYLFTGKDQYEGVCHGDDYMYIYSLPLFPMQKLCKTDKDMQTFLFNVWTKFARTGEVSRTASVDWKPVPTDGKTLLHLHIRSPDKMFMEDANKIYRYRDMWKDLPLAEDAKLFPNLHKDEL